MPSSQVLCLWIVTLVAFIVGVQCKSTRYYPTESDSDMTEKIMDKTLEAAADLLDYDCADRVCAGLRGLLGKACILRYCWLDVAGGDAAEDTPPAPADRITGEDQLGEATMRRPTSGTMSKRRWGNSLASCVSLRCGGMVGPDRLSCAVNICHKQLAE